ncbi:MAG: GlmU family protein, partial [Saprospiraceae bacterium]|nr:GlmU family protein [Saprospiraceae bacterium]
NLLPLTFMRPIAEIRFGILTMREKWEKYLNVKTSTLTEEYLNKKFPIIKGEENILINSTICPNNDLLKRIKELKSNQTLISEDKIIAMFLNEDELESVGDADTIGVEEIVYDKELLEISFPWDIFSKNSDAIKLDFDLITKGRKSEAISENVFTVNPENIFIEKGAKVEFASLNASNGPIYIGKDAEIMEACAIRGPFALCENSTVKMGAKIYGPTTIGPFSKVGGEVNNSVFFGYSNKAHDGFMGQSVISEWCNIGADTNISNLKNTYDEVRIWSYPKNSFVSTDLQFCGLILGDHSKLGINTMINTGTVIGVNCNIFGAGFPRNFIPSFSWGGHSGFSDYNLKKACDVAEAVYKRRNMEFNDIEKNILETVYKNTFQVRNS